MRGHPCAAAHTQLAADADASTHTAPAKRAAPKPQEASDIGKEATMLSIAYPSSKTHAAGPGAAAARIASAAPAPPGHPAQRRRGKGPPGAIAGKEKGSANGASASATAAAVAQRASGGSHAASAISASAAGTATAASGGIVAVQARSGDAKPASRSPGRPRPPDAIRPQ